MADSKTHPHIDMPSEDDLSRVVEGRPPAVREAYLACHRLILEVVPEIHYAVDTVDGQIGYGARQFGYDGWGMLALAPYRGWVTLAFIRGAGLPDPAGLLEGASATGRHVKVKSTEQLAERRDAIKALLEGAKNAT